MIRWLTLFILLPVLASASQVTQKPGGRIQRNAVATFYIDGYAEVVSEIIYGSVYGGNQTPYRQSGNGPPFTAADAQKYDSLIGEYGKLVRSAAKRPGRKGLVRSIVDLVHRFHRENLAAIPGGRRADQGDYVKNLASRRTACGDVALALSLLLTEAGYRTRLVMISPTPQGLQKTNHISLEVFSPIHEKWILVEGMDNYLPEYDGKALGVFEVFRHPVILAKLNQGGGSGVWKKTSLVHMILPSPTYDRTIEVLWTPEKGAIDLSRSHPEQPAAR